MKRLWPRSIYLYIQNLTSAAPVVMLSLYHACVHYSSLFCQFCTDCVLSQCHEQKITQQIYKRRVKIGHFLAQIYAKMLTLLHFVLFMLLSSVFDVKSKIKTQSNMKLVIMSFLDEREKLD